jgi:hypothetical protein
MTDSLQINPSAPAAGARDEVSLRVLLAFIANIEVSQRQLVGERGVSLAGPNFALKALIEKDFVKVGSFRKPDSRLLHPHILTPMGIAEKTCFAAQFLGRKLVKYGLLRREIETLKSDLGPFDKSEKDSCDTGLTR